MKNLLVNGMLALLLADAALAADALPSWNDLASKQSVIAFVDKVTTPGSKDFVPVPERIAVFDNDGTLWSEQPMYFQAFFVFDRIDGATASGVEDGRAVRIGPQG